MALLLWVAYMVGHAQGWSKGQKSGRFRGLLEAQQIVGYRRHNFFKQFSYDQVVP